MNDSVTLTFGAQTRNVTLARTLAAAMAARADLPIDRLEDVRLAVDEAVTQLVIDAPANAEIICTFTLDEDSLDVRVSCASVSGAPPSTNTFSWTVLSALVDDVAASVDAGSVTLDLHIRRDLSVVV